MKKKLLLLLLLVGLMCISLCACESDEDADATRSNELSEKYEFYDDSISTIRGEMELTTKQANSVFETLIEVGLDEEVNHCFSNKDEFYDVWWGLTKVQVYLTDGAVSKITAEDFELYPTPLESLIIWNDNTQQGTISFELEVNVPSTAMTSAYPEYIADFLNVLNKEKLGDYKALRFHAKVFKDGESLGTLISTLDMDYIKNTDEFSTGDVSANLTYTGISPLLK